MAFQQKLLNVSFSLADGSFAGGGNTSSLTGYRVSAHIDMAGGASQSHCELAIYGMSLSDMNSLTTFGSQFGLQNKNGLMVQAIDESGTTLVFQGNIFQAWVDAQAMPQVCLRVVATPGSFYNAKPQTPLSFQGATPASTIAGQIAGNLGMTLENNGVNTVLSNPYLGGSAIDQIQKLSEHAGFDYIMDKGVLAITPAGQSRAGGPVQIDAQDYMAGYPLFVSNNLVVRARFNPNVMYQGLIQVQSDLTPACGTWKVTKLEYDLESFVPHGKWFLTATCITTSSVDTAT